MPLEAELLPADEIDHIHIGVMQSPFHQRFATLNINQAWTEWNGYATSSYYADSHIEYFSTRNTCGVFDVSPMRKYRFKGADAEAMLNRMVTRDVCAQKLDMVAYNIWCTDKGRVVDDGTLFRSAQDDFMLCCADPCFDWFQLSAVGFEQLEITDISEDIAALALQDRSDESTTERGIRGATAANKLVFRQLLIWAVIIAAMTLYGLTR